MLALVAAVAVVHLCVAAAAVPAETGPAVVSSDAEAISPATGLLAAVMEIGGEAWQHFRQWLGQSYERAPALMLGLSVLLAVPPLALAGLVARRKRRPANVTVMLPRRRRRAGGKPRTATAKTEISPWPTEAWVDIEGVPGGRCAIGQTLVRIGREDDNDIRFSAKTVHRYHAAIRRTADGEVFITDLSGPEGNGVLVNGARVVEARLAKGDVINVGEIRMRFDARMV